MKPIAIVTDSTSDLPDAIADRLRIHIVPCNVHFGTQVFRERVDLSNDEFYRRLAASAQLPKTSQPSSGVFEDLYRALAPDHSGIVSIHIAAKLSGTLQSAIIAAKNLPDTPIAAIDSGSTSMGLGWIAILAARAALEGKSHDDVVCVVRDALPRVRILALLDNLDNVTKGGRIGKGAAFLGTMLSVKPILSVRDGEVIPLEKPRTWQKAQARLVELTKELLPLEELAVLHARAPDAAQRLCDQLSAFWDRDRILVTELGAVLGTHAGPGTVGIAALASAPLQSLKN